MNHNDPLLGFYIIKALGKINKYEAENNKKLKLAKQAPPLISNPGWRLQLGKGLIRLGEWLSQPSNPKQA